MPTGMPSAPRSRPKTGDVAVPGPCMIDGDDAKRGRSGSTATMHVRENESVPAPVLHAEGITHAFGSLVVTDSVTLALAHGERHGLIGPNGAGKTTLFDIIAGEVVPDAGTVRLAGTDVTRFTPDRRARLGLARSFQRNNLFTDLTVRENLAIASAIAHGVSHVAWRAFARHRAVHESAEVHAVALGLGDILDTVVRHLSYGTQRQIEIALALALEPKVLLLDEPTAGMSPEETAAMREMIAALPSSLTLLVIEHDMEVLFGFANRITVLDYGRVLLRGDPTEVRDSEAVRSRYLGTHA